MQELKAARAEFISFTDRAKAADLSSSYNIGELAAHGLDIIDNVCAKAVKLGNDSSTAQAVTAAQAEFMQNCEPVFKAFIAESTATVDRAAAAQVKLNDDLTSVTNGTILTTYAAVLVDSW